MIYVIIMNHIAKIKNIVNFVKNMDTLLNIAIIYINNNKFYDNLYIKL